MTNLRWITCVCGKHAYRTKADAKRARKTAPNGNALQVYRCAYASWDAWHLGNPRGHNRAWHRKVAAHKTAPAGS